VVLTDQAVQQVLAELMVQAEQVAQVVHQALAEVREQAVQVVLVVLQGDWFIT
jgi:flagellar biosynthesis/type III secretory pathway protein FliH